MTYEEIIKALAERYNALSALDDDGSLAIEVDGTLVSFRKANGAVAVVARVCFSKLLNATRRLRENRGLRVRCACAAVRSHSKSQVER